MAACAPSFAQLHLGGSEQLLAATQEAAKRVREAETRASKLESDGDELKRELAAERKAREGDHQSAVQHAEDLRRVVKERDAANQSATKAKGELGALRLHLLEAEESSRSREAELHSDRQELQSRASRAGVEREEQAEAVLAAGRRAARAEEELVGAQRRCAEQETALANLQSLLEQLQPPAGDSPPGDDDARMHLAAQLLVAELRVAEDELTASGEAAKLGEHMQSSLAAAHEEIAAFSEERGALEELLRASHAATNRETSIDKRLAASVLAKYFERGRSEEVLSVLASMLECTRAEQQALGLLPPGDDDGMFSGKDAADKWIDFLTSEAEPRGLLMR